MASTPRHPATSDAPAVKCARHNCEKPALPDADVCADHATTTAEGADGKPRATREIKSPRKRGN